MAGSALVEVNGHKVFVEIAGSGEQPLFSLHGLGGGTNMFPIANELSSKYTVIRMDFHGAGKSPLAGPLSVDGWVEDVKAVLEYAGFKGVPAILYGHSMGSTVSMYFAAKYPELVKKMVLSCPGAPKKPFEGAPPVNPLAALSRTKGTFNMGDNTAMRNLRPNATYIELALVRACVQACGNEAYAQTCEAIMADQPPAWEKITSPTLIIAGKHDVISNEANALLLAEVLPAGTKVIPVEAGHQPAIEVPEKVLEILAEFL